MNSVVFETVADGGRFIIYGSSGGACTVVDPQEARRRGVRVINALEAGPPAPDTVRQRLAEALT